MRLQATRVFLMARKDLRLFMQDRGALLFALAFPLVFVFGFSLLIGQAAAQDAPIEFVLATREGDASVSSAIIASVTGDSSLKARQLTEDEARRRVAAGDLAGFLLFPADFSQRLIAGEPTGLTVVTDPCADYAVRGWLAGFARSLAGTLSNQQAVVSAASELVAQAGGPLDEMGLQRAIASFRQSTPAVTPIAFVQAGDVQATQQTNTQLPGYLTMFVFFTASFAAAELVRERDNHTLDRLVAGGVTRGTVLAGKWVGTVARGAFQATVLWTVGVLLFGVDMGRAPVGTALVTAGMVLASASFAIALASLARSERSASSLAVLAALTLAPLGGCWWPLYVASPLMQQIAKVTPHAWANEAFNRLLLFGADTTSILPHLAALLAFTVVFGAAGWFRVRTRL